MTPLDKALVIAASEPWHLHPLRAGGPLRPFERLHYVPDVVRLYSAGVIDVEGVRRLNDHLDSPFLTALYR